MVNETEDNLENLKCPKCNSEQVYTRVIKKERVCKRCGNIWSLDLEETK